MTPDLLRDAGEALYGPLWQSELARALGVNGRTVRRWMAKDNAIPAGVWPEVGNLVLFRRLALAALAGKLERCGGSP